MGYRLTRRPRTGLRAAAIGLALVTGTGGALAHTGYRDADVHVHGRSALAIAADGEVLDMEWVAPLSDVTGFEHAPRTPEERKTWADARTRLEAGEGLLVPSTAARCVLQETRVAFGAEETGAASPASAEAGHTHGHDHDHGGTATDAKHESHHDHGDEGHGHEKHGGHKDLVASFRFRCARPSRLERIEVKLFERFARMERVEVSFLGPNRQTAATLTPNNSVFRLK